MASTAYDPEQLTARDRVRRLIADVGATLRFQDEEIAYALLDNGFDGDPNAELAKQELPELLAAIMLLEISSLISGDTQTIKQGSVTRTNASGADYSRILVFLRSKLSLLQNGDLDAGASIFVAECEFDDLDPLNGYPSYA